MRLLSCLILLAACGGPVVPATIENTTFAGNLGVDLSKSTKTADGLYYRDINAGTGPALAVGQTVKVHYVGALPNGQTFDSNVDPQVPFSFALGVGQVIAGWDEGLQGAAVGSTRQLIIPPALGYGPYPVGSIPPNSILVFNVSIVSAQ
jgi:FKBP-type peptidyl-prolyl cis-trans isomerase